MTKPTGRPRGRPKTKEYVTLMARVDVALADQVQRYARLHRQTISDVLRDGLQALFSEQDPWHPIMSDTNRDTAIVSDMNGVIEEKVSDRNGDEKIMSDTKTVPAAILSTVGKHSRKIPDRGLKGAITRATLSF